MLIGNLPEDTTISEEGFLLYSEDGVHAVKIRKKNVMDSGVTVYYGISNPSSIIGMTPKDGDIYFKLNGQSLESSTQISRIYVYVDNGNQQVWVPSSFSNAGDVQWTQLYGDGEQIATVTIDGYSIPVYAPNGGTQIQIDDVLYSGIDIATITLNGYTFTLKAPSVSGVATDAVIEYINDQGQTIDVSVMDDGVAKFLIDYDTLVYSTQYGLCTNMKVANGYIGITNPDFASDNTSAAFELPREGTWMVTISAKLNSNAQYQTTDPSEYLYIKGVGNIFENGNIEERVPIILYSGETLNTQSLLASGIATVTAQDNSFTIHIGGNLQNALASGAVTVYMRAFRMGG